jgi:hypothetical protein
MIFVLVIQKGKIINQDDIEQVLKKITPKEFEDDFIKHSQKMLKNKKLLDISPSKIHKLMKEQTKTKISKDSSIYLSGFFDYLITGLVSLAIKDNKSIKETIKKEPILKKFISKYTNYPL